MIENYNSKQTLLWADLAISSSISTSRAAFLLFVFFQVKSRNFVLVFTDINL